MLETMAIALNFQAHSICMMAIIRHSGSYDLFFAFAMPILTAWCLFWILAYYKQRKKKKHTTDMDKIDGNAIDSIEIYMQTTLFVAMAAWSNILFWSILRAHFH